MADRVGVSTESKLSKWMTFNCILLFYYHLTATRLLFFNWSFSKIVNFNSLHWPSFELVDFNWLNWPVDTLRVSNEQAIELARKKVNWIIIVRFPQLTALIGTKMATKISNSVSFAWAKLTTLNSVSNSLFSRFGSTKVETTKILNTHAEQYHVDYLDTINRRSVRCTD